MPDTRHMRRALDLASAARGSVSPRPPVGAIVVSPDGKVVGEGCTQPTPGPHAEVVALERAGTLARGATLYVTLEPCTHTTVTGPCAEAVLDAGIAEVVAGTRDPDPRVSGRGFRRLREAGVAVSTRMLRDRCRAMIEPFETLVTLGRPFVTMKLAATIDGKLAAPDGTSRWITGEQSRREVHELRSRVDAVLIGAGTACADDPSLDVRLDPPSPRQPVHVLVDSSGRTPPDARLFSGSTVVLTAAGVATRWPAFTVDVPRADGGIDLHEGMRVLGGLGMCHVLVEAGPTLASALVSEGLVDELILYQAPKLLGGDAPGILASGVKTLSEAWSWRVVDVRRVGDDIRTTLRP